MVTVVGCRCGVGLVGAAARQSRTQNDEKMFSHGLTVRLDGHHSVTRCRRCAGRLISKKTLWI